MDTSDLAKRMKKYEAVPKNVLMGRMPVIIRLDGKAWHTFTRKFERPFDKVLMRSMQETMRYLCENIQGCVLGYTQSDETSLVLIDYQKLESSAWFDYEVQKMCSIAASMATMAFNKIFMSNVQSFGQECCCNAEDMQKENGDGQSLMPVPGREEDYDRYCNVYSKVLLSAMFDARVFNLSKDEVANYIYWRQLDASRNSVQMVGQANFSHKQLHGKTCNMVKEMLIAEKGINWEELPVERKRGSCAIKVEKEIAPETGQEAGYRTEWLIDREIPVFKGEDREYIEKRIMVGE